MCAIDSDCLGVGWLSNSPHCWYHKFQNAPHRAGQFLHAYHHHALYKKSDKGKITKCVKPKVANANLLELVPC